MDSLVKFSTEVIKTAQSHREAELNEIKSREEERLRSAKNDTDSKKLSKIRIECNKIKLSTDKEISILKNDLKKDIFRRRQEMLEDIFAQVTQNAKEYKSGDRYIEDMIKSLKLAAEKIGGEDLVCCIKEEDGERLKKEFPEISFVAAAEDIIGGFSLMSREKGLYLDMTLKSRIEEQRQEFYKKSGLVINQ